MNIVSKNNIWAGLLLFLLFSLSPCSVKSSILRSVDLGYEKTLNKNKSAATQLNNCSVDIKDSIISNTKDKKRVITPFLCDDNSSKTISYLEQEDEKPSNTDFYDQKRLPKYLLYQKMLIDFV